MLNGSSRVFRYPGCLQESANTCHIPLDEGQLLAKLNFDGLLTRCDVETT